MSYVWKMAHCSGTALVHQLHMQHMLFTSPGAVSKTLNSPVNYEFTLFLYTLGSDMSRIKRIFWHAAHLNLDRIG
jgi:hypothetical protein